MTPSGSILGRRDIKPTVWNAGIDAARKFLKTYRGASSTNSQIVAAMTADARAIGFSEMESAEVAECGLCCLKSANCAHIEPVGIKKLFDAAHITTKPKSGLSLDRCQNALTTATESDSV
jgi:hypothetical protein